MNNLVQAKKFLLSCIRGGLAHSYDSIQKTWTKPYPEVTGYLLSYFCSENTLYPEIMSAADKLVQIQDESGGFPSFYNTNILFTFDTAQIAHGLLSMYIKTKRMKYLKSAIRAGDFLLKMQWLDGSFFPMFHRQKKNMLFYQEKEDGSNWGSTLSFIQLKNIEALLLLSKITKEKKYSIATIRVGRWGMKKSDPRYSHPYAYFLEGMYALGKRDFVRNELKKNVLSNLKRGFIPYYPGASFAYVSGSVQLGILLSKFGFNREAKDIYKWAINTQDCNMGGLIQYANQDGSINSSIHGELNSWGTKYFCELAKNLKVC